MKNSNVLYWYSPPLPLTPPQLNISSDRSAPYCNTVLIVSGLARTTTPLRQATCDSTTRLLRTITASSLPASSTVASTSLSTPTRPSSNTEEFPFVDNRNRRPLTNKLIPLWVVLGVLGVCAILGALAYYFHIKPARRRKNEVNLMPGTGLPKEQEGVVSRPAGPTTDGGLAAAGEDAPPPTYEKAVAGGA